MDKKFLLKLLAVSTSFVWEVLVAILIGLFLGGLIDDWLGFERPIGVSVLMLLGAAAAVRNFIVRVTRLGEKESE